MAKADSPFTTDTKPDRGTLEISYKGRKLLVYAYATNQFKPYVRELYTLRGENVLRDAPPDHLHHHGLMYACYVNGINFWEERVAPGIERHMGLVVATMEEMGEKHLPAASFTERVHWLAPTNSNDPLLVEQRQLVVAVDEKTGEVALRWSSEFNVGPGVGKVVIRGPNYNGLGMRLPESFNHVAKFQNAAKEPYVSKNSQNAIGARWTSVVGQMEGREVMLAMFGRPENARGDGFFFTMLDPFAYLAATQGLEKQPLEYGAGDHFNLSYLLTVYGEQKSPEFIAQRYDQWNKENK
jgi:hypothetical protein